MSRFTFCFILFYSILFFQLGLTFIDENGKSPSTFTYQFNFKFSLNEDMYAQDSIDLLQKSGIQFHKHEEQGVGPVIAPRVYCATQTKY